LNLSEIVIRGARYFGNKNAPVFQDERYAHPELNALIDGIAAYLNEAGIQPADRVARYLPNGPQWIAVYYAVIRIGALSVCVSSAYKRDEISDHPQSWGYEDGPWKGPGPPLLVAADLSQFISRRHRSSLHLSNMPSR